MIYNDRICIGYAYINSFLYLYSSNRNI